MAVVFAQGCPWNCTYCHNPHLLPAGEGSVPWAEVVEFLRTRVDLLDGVVFSGGEPTVQAALADAIAEVRELGFRVGLHTGGPNPARLAEILPYVDWVGFDVKAPFADYERITHVAGSGERALASLHALVSSGVPFEIRTTVHPDLLGEEELERLSVELAEEGVARWAVQAYRPDGAREGLRDARLYESGVPESVRARFAEFVFRAR